MTKREFVHDLVSSAVTRRTFAKSAMAAGFGVGAATLMAGTASPAEAQGLTDTDILNFALNLEYLEAEFYTVITSGVTIDRPPHSIPISGVGAQGPTFGAGRLDFGGERLLEQTALELAFDERAHVVLLRNALGAAAVAKPTINFTAGGVTTVARFLQVARVLEDVGVSAYGGAAPLIQSRDILAVAARIALAEGEHTGNIRFQLTQRGVADLGPIDPLDIPAGSPATATRRLFSVDQQGLTAVRTPGQVLSIVYGPGAPSGTTRGGLFPDGLNGTIRTV
jgi:hypothetical protein